MLYDLWVFSYGFNAFDFFFLILFIFCFF